MLLFALLYAISCVFMIRMILVTLGIWKGPILRVFEKYGDEENSYNTLPRLLLGIGLFALSSSLWMAATFPTAFIPLQTIGIILLALALLSFYMRTFARRIFRYPQWYYELEERTSRSERRRIAYMWLRLPLKAKLQFNSSDHAFSHWADIVILSTIHL